MHIKGGTAGEWLGCTTASCTDLPMALSAIAPQRLSVGGFPHRLFQTNIQRVTRRARGAGTPHGGETGRKGVSQAVAKAVTGG